MRTRDLRARDAPRLLEFLRLHFTEEERILGTRPEGFEEVVRRVFRWDARIALGLLRLLNRPIFRFFVIESDDGAVIATTLVTFPARAGFLSLVAVDPAFRRRGLARQLLERARTATVRRGRPYLALDVLEQNLPARTLYASLGYRPLRRSTYAVLERPPSLPAGLPPVPGLRPFAPSDAGPLAAIARAEKPPEVEAVLPTTSGDIGGSALVGRILHSESAAWVLDEGQGPVAWISANVSPAQETGYVSAPIIGPSVAPATAVQLVATATAWLAARRVPRVTLLPSEDNRRGRAALEAVGFRDEIGMVTLYRPAT